MLNVGLNQVEGIAILVPDGELTEEDFQSAANLIDPYIETAGKLNGIIIHVKSFPGWDSFSALVSHLKFIRDHHEKVSFVALATDSPIGKFAEIVASHFVNAEIKEFSFNELENAKKWILEGNTK